MNSSWKTSWCCDVCRKNGQKSWFLNPINHGRRTDFVSPLLPCRFLCVNFFWEDPYAQLLWLLVLCISIYEHVPRPLRSVVIGILSLSIAILFFFYFLWKLFSLFLNSYTVCILTFNGAFVYFCMKQNCVENILNLHKKLWSVDCFVFVSFCILQYRIEEHQYSHEFYKIFSCALVFCDRNFLVFLFWNICYHQTE